MGPVTVLYYTANRETESFEVKVRQRLIENMGNLPLVSVSQKPLPGFGKNICVGIHDNCYANEFRQIQTGLREVMTPYVLTAEADCLYPPEYFQFQPPVRGYCYRYTPVWVHFGSDHFRFKRHSDCAQAVDRELWLNTLDEALGDKEGFFNKDDTVAIPRFKSDGRYSWTSDSPVVTFKTGQGVHGNTQTIKGVLPRYSLPYWGSAAELWKEMIA